MLVEMGGYRLGWVGFAQNDAQRSIQIVAHAGEGSDYLEQLDPSWSEHHPRGQGPAGLTVRSGHSVIVRDVASTTLQADWADRMVGQGFHGVMALPLRAAGHTFGLLYLYAPEVLLIGTEEEALMQQLADDLAFGIMSLRARREQQQLQASVLKMAAAVSATTGAEFFVQLARNMGEALGARFTPGARRLAERFWPGPLTLVVPDADGSGTLGLRAPDSPFVQAVIAGLGGGIVATSANPSGQPPPLDADAADAFPEGVDLLIDGGPCSVGVASDVIRCTDDTYAILREGAIGARAIASAWSEWGE